MGLALSNTRYGSVGAGQLRTTPANAYAEAAWLVSQFFTKQGQATL